MQDDGNLVLYTLDNKPVWSSKTNAWFNFFSSCFCQNCFFLTKITLLQFFYLLIINFTYQLNEKKVDFWNKELILTIKYGGISEIS